jgi:hypothetical protein
VTNKLDDIRQSWKHTNCTILSDGWSDLCHRPLINVLAYSPQGVYFLKAVNAMDELKHHDLFSEFWMKQFRWLGRKFLSKLS